MEHYPTGPHSGFDLKYHSVWITKDRKGVLVGEVAGPREPLREACRTCEVEFLRGSTSRVHVHVLLSCPPNLSPSEVMQYIKGKTSRKLLVEFRHLRKQYSGFTCGQRGASWRRASRT